MTTTASDTAGITRACELLSAARVLLLDFDVPVTPLLPAPHNLALADQLRTVAQAHGMSLPGDLATTSDHLAILRAAARHDPATLDAVERAAIAGEVEAAHRSPLTPGIVDLLHQCHQRGMRVAMVSNNPAVCIEVFLQLHHLEHLVAQVQGRTACHPEWMKPDPRVLQLALADTPAAEAVMLGDSTSDMIAATTLAIPAIGLADTPAKASLLRDAGATAIITAITDLT